MIEILVFSAVVCGACIYMVLRANVSHSDADLALYKQMTQERSEWSAERLRMMGHFQVREAELLNRIKPETSQYPMTEQLQPIAVPDFEDDEQHWANVPSNIKDLVNDASQNGVTV